MTLLEQAQDILNQLSPEKLQIAVDFLAYIHDKESQEATDELLSIPNFEKELKEAEEEIKRGEFVSFKEIRHFDDDPLLEIIGIFEGKALSSTEIDQELYK
jgi:hypothetical protein